MSGKSETKLTSVETNGAGDQGDPPKDERDICIFYNGEYYYVPFAEWQKAMKLPKGERSILVPLIDNGTLLADVNHPEPPYGTWTNLLNLTALLKGAEPAAPEGEVTKRGKSG